MGSSTPMKAFTVSQANVPLVPEPGYVSQTSLYLIFNPLILYVKTIDKTYGFGVRIESVLVVCSVQTVMKAGTTSNG
jgi:hypothetical protein